MIQFFVCYGRFIDLLVTYNKFFSKACQFAHDSHACSVNFLNLQVEGTSITIKL